MNVTICKEKNLKNNNNKLIKRHLSRKTKSEALNIEKQNMIKTITYKQHN